MRDNVAARGDTLAYRASGIDSDKELQVGAITLDLTLRLLLPETTPNPSRECPCEPERRDPSVTSQTLKLTIVAGPSNG